MWDKGFTLIELMVVLAIVGIVMAMGVPAYQSYAKNARITTVDVNYKNAIRVLRNEMYKRASITARGGTQIPANFTGASVYTDILNPDGTVKAGDGVSLAYAAASASASGVIGVVVTNSTDGSLSVNVIRPAYAGGASAGGLDEETTQLVQADL